MYNKIYHRFQSAAYFMFEYLAVVNMIRCFDTDVLMSCKALPNTDIFVGQTDQYSFISLSAFFMLFTFLPKYIVVMV